MTHVNAKKETLHVHKYTLSLSLRGPFRNALEKEKVIKVFCPLIEYRRQTPCTTTARQYPKKCKGEDRPQTHNANTPPPAPNVHPASAAIAPINPYTPTSPPTSYPPPYVSTNPASASASPQLLSISHYAAQRGPSPSVRAASSSRRYRQAPGAAGRCAPRSDGLLGGWRRVLIFLRRRGGLER